MSTRITDLPQAETLNGSEVMPLVQNGVTKKATLDFINLAAPAALILQQTQQVYQDTVDVKTATDAVLIETQSVLTDTQNVLGQTVTVRDQTEVLKLDFETQYLGPHPSAPTLNNEGNPLEVGALYWDTTLMAMFVWDGATWTAFSSAVASVNGFIGEVVLGFADVRAAGPGANTNITSLGGLTGDVAAATGVQFDTAAPSAVAVGKLTWNVADSTLDLGVSASSVLQIGQDVYYRVKNGTLNPISNGSLVRLSGTEGNSGNLLVEMVVADGTHPSETFLGLTTEVLAPGASGFATYFGKVRGIDTTGNSVGEVWADGDILYASTTLTGGLTKVEPEAPNNKVMVALVVHAHPNGVLFVRPSYGSNLGNDELVQLDTLTDGDVLQYDAAQFRFENRSLNDAGIEPLGAAAASMTAHLLDADPHPQYTTTAEASAAAPVQSVAGKTGAVALVKADVGLANVDNTSDLNKPISAATQTALNSKQPLDAELTAISGLSANGLITRTGTGAAASRSIAVSGTGLSVTNADGVAGNPTVTSNATTANTASTIVARDASGNFTAGTITAALAGNAATATKLATARTISLTGDVTGSVSFDGTANTSITATVVDDSHSHIVANVDGLQTVLDGKVAKDSNTGSATLPAGTTAQRSAVPVAGALRFNSTLTQFEGYDGTAWDAISKPDASLVGFQQEGAGAVVRTAQDKLREFVTPYDFGAVGDGVADDTVAVQAFMSSGRSLNWLGGTYRITSQISVTASKDYLWSSSGACVVVDSSTPIESAIKIELAGFDAFLKGNIEIDCQDDAYAGLLVLNNASVFATCEIDGPIIRNVYRSGTTFNVGDGIYVFGAYSRVVIRNFEIRSVKMAVGAGVPRSYGVTGVTVQRFNNSTRDAEFVLIEDFFIDRIYSEDVAYGARDQDGIRVQQAYQKSEAATYTNPVTAIVQNGRIKNAHGRAIKMVSEYGIIKNIQVARNVEIYSGFKISASEDFDFQVSGGSLSGIRCYYNDNCPDSVATFFIALVDGRRSPTAVSVDDVVVSSFVLAPTRLIDVDVGTAPSPAFVQISVSNVHVSGSLIQLDEIVRLRNINNLAVSAINYYVLLTNVMSRVTRSFVWRESATIDNETAVTAIQCVKSNPTNVPLVTGALTTRILSSLVGQNYRLT